MVDPDRRAEEPVAGAWRVAAEHMVVAEVPTTRMTMLRVGRDAGDEELARLGDAAGVALVGTPNVATGSATRAIWMGPREWMIVGGHPDAAAIEAAAGGTTVLATDVSAGRYVAVATGTAIRDLLAKGTSLDLHPRVFPHGRTAMTLFAQVPVIIERRDDAGFILYFDVSLRGHVRAWFEDAVVEFGGR